MSLRWILSCPWSNVNGPQAMYHRYGWKEAPAGKRESCIHRVTREGHGHNILGFVPVFAISLRFGKSKPIEAPSLGPKKAEDCPVRVSVPLPSSLSNAATVEPPQGQRVFAFSCARSCI